MATTKEVLEQHLKSFGEGSLDGLLADYSPDAVLFIPDRPLKGAEEIKPFFQALLTEFAKPGASFSLEKQVIDGDYGYIVWRAETADQIYQAATDTFFVSNGKIVAQSFFATTVSKQAMASVALTACGIV